MSAIMSTAHMLISSPIVERGRKAVDMIADLKKCWARFEETAGIRKSQGKSAYALMHLPDTDFA